jgi:hypothetical protein
MAIVQSKYQYVAIAAISYIIMMIMIHDGMVIDVCPSVTLDDGTFLIYDIRVRPVGAPAFKANMGKKVYPLYPIHGYNTTTSLFDTTITITQEINECSHMNMWYDEYRNYLRMSVILIITCCLVLVMEKFNILMFVLLIACMLTISPLTNNTSLTLTFVFLAFIESKTHSCKLLGRWNITQQEIIFWFRECRR